MIVGFTDLDYATRRNIVGRVAGCRYVLVRDALSVTRSVVGRIPSIPALSSKVYSLRFRFRSPSWPHADIIHLWNGVAKSRTPWVSTFETVLPRYQNIARDAFLNPEALRSRSDVQTAIEWMMAGSCRKLVALSDCARRMQLSLWDRAGVSDAELREKLVTLHPPQPLLIDAIDRKPDWATHPLLLVMVGRAFFRKGGAEVLAALGRLWSEGRRDFRLTVVSDLTMDEYATHRDQQDRIRAAEILAREPWITWYKQLQSHEVHHLLVSAHVGLLPSHAETYGYAVLEYQAAGCPVITTDVRAFPEINSTRVGWMINVPKSDRGEALYRTARMRRYLATTIQEGVYDAVKALLDDPMVVRAKGIASLDRIARHHSPQAHAFSLRAIYAKD